VPLVAQVDWRIFGPVGGLSCDDTFCALEREALIVQKVSGQSGVQKLRDTCVDPRLAGQICPHANGLHI
jgi:hypothetical protein